jgi:uncharacterized membrane protein YbhN (UPF0104 family)
VRKLFGPLLILAIVGSLAFVQRTVLVDIWNRLIELPRISLVPLLGAAVVMIIARGAFLAACSPGVTLRQAVMTDQSALAAGYGIVLGGGLVGTGMRIHMFTRWGVAHISIASSIIATAVVPSFSTWGLPVVLLSIPVIRGTATSPQALAVLVGVPIILFSLVFWWMALRSAKVFLLVGRFSAWLRGFLLRKISQRFVRIRAGVERTQPLAFSAEMRVGLIALLRKRWLVIFASSVGTLAAGFTCLWTSAVVFEVQGLTLWEALVAFSLVRVVIALSPIPGGTGLAELGLIALLERAGVSTIDATGTTLLYRSLTWFSPIVVGSSMWWRYSRSEKSLTDSA